MFRRGGIDSHAAHRIKNTHGPVMIAAGVTRLVCMVRVMVHGVGRMVMIAVTTAATALSAVFFGRSHGSIPCLHHIPYGGI
jgi:hypothetical protein